MRILIYGFSGAVLGGIEMFVLNMNEHMSKDCVFDYIIDGDECVFSDRIKDRGGKIFFIPWVRKSPFGYIGSLWHILGEQKRLGTKVLYQQLFSMSNLIPAILAKLRGYRVIIHAHNNGLQKAGRLYVLAHYLGRVFSHVLGVTFFTNSRLSTDFMFGKGAKAELVYNAIDSETFSFTPVFRDAAREEMDSRDKTVIGFVGRLVAQKNPVFMLKVYEEIHKLEPNTELWIIGDGEQKEQMCVEIENSGISSSVKILGRRNDVNRLMMGMDLLLQPSLFEGLGIVLIEAQATGLPVVTSESVVPDEAVVTDYIKLLPLSESPTYWARESLGFLKLCQNNGSRIGARVPESYNIDHEAVRLELLLKGIGENK